MPFRCRPAFRAIRPLARTVAMALAALLVLAAPPAPAQGLFDQIQELGKKIQESVPKNERPGTAATTAPRNGTGSGGISAERRAAMALQQGLNDLGFDAGVVDGLPGAQTRAAIGRFQAARGFDVTGALTPAQRRVFDTDVARVAGDRAAVETAEIAEMQAYLAALGYSVGTPDGAYGPRTAAALDAFRRDSGLPGGAGPTATDAASLYARVHGVAPAARPAGTALAAAAPGTAPAQGTGFGTVVTPGGGQPALAAPAAPVLAAPAAGTGADTGPSFDCALALSDAERAICADPRLGTLDRQLAAAWAAASAAGTPAEEQRAWLAERNACGTDAACLAATMQARLGALTGTATGTGTMTAAGAPDTPAPAAAPPVTEADRVHIVNNQTARLPGGLARRILMAQIAANPAMLDSESTLQSEYIAREVARTGQPQNVVYQEFQGLNMIARDDVLRETRARLAAEAQAATPITPDNPIPVALYVPASAADYDDTQGLVLQPTNQNAGARIEGLSFTVPMAEVPGIAHVPLDRAAASALLDRIKAEGAERRMLMRVAFGRITGLDPQVPSRARFELDEVDLAFVPQFNRNMPDAWTPRRPDGPALHTWTPAPAAPADPAGPAAPAAAGVHVFENQVPVLPDGFARRLTLAALREAPALLENLGSVRPFFIADRAAETGESENAVSQQFYALNTLEQEDILRAKRTALMAEAEGVTSFDAAAVPVAIYVPGQFSGEFDASKGLVIRGNITAQMSLGQRAPGLNAMPIAFAGMPDLTHMAVTRDTAKDLLDRVQAEAAQGRQLYRVVWGRIDGITNVDGYGRVQLDVTVDRVTAHFMSRYRSHDGNPFMPAVPEAALFTWEPAPVLDDPVDAGPEAPLAARLAAIDPVGGDRLLAEAVALQGGDEALYAQLAETFHEVQGANEFDRPAARAAAIETLKTAGDGPIWIEGSTSLGEYDLAAETFAMQPDYLRWRVNGGSTTVSWRFGLVGPEPFTALPVPPEVARPIVEADQRGVRFLMRVVPMQVAVSGSPARPQYSLTLRPEEVIFFRDGERDPQTREPKRDPLAARDFAAENAALEDRLSRRFEPAEFDGLADRVPELSPHVLDLIAVRATGSAPRDAMALHSMMLTAWAAQDAGALPGPGFFDDAAPQPAADDAAALLHPSFRSYLEAKAAALGDRFTVRLHDRRIETCGHVVALERFYGNQDPIWQTVAALPGIDAMLDVQMARNNSEGPVAAPLRVGQVQQRPDARYGCASWIGLIALKDGIYQPRDAGYGAVEVTFTLDDSRSFDGARDLDDQVVIGTVLETRPVMADGSLGDPLAVPEPEPEPEPVVAASPEPVPEPAPAPAVAAAPAAPATPAADPADWPAPDTTAPDLSGIDLIGLRTGMAMADADAALRGRDDVMAVFETPAPPEPGRYGAHDGPGPLDYRRVYLLRDGQEAVTLASYAPGGPVLAIMRRLVLAQGILPYDRIEAALVDKYGPATGRMEEDMMQAWGPRDATDCMALPFDGYGAGLVPVPDTGAEGLNPVDFAAAQMSIGSMAALDSAGLSACGPVLIYMAERPEMWGASGFSATLIDHAALAGARDALGAAPETVDIEIEF
ncbi:peptidoglycan-binding protein [Meridianimarinicoccus sp. RP-17]